MNLFSAAMKEKNITVGCVIMASGGGKRFGSDKLLAEFNGAPLAARAIELSAAFDAAVVVTRSEGVSTLCNERGAEYILHSKQLRSDTVRIGIEHMTYTDGCCFMAADQPLLSRGSVDALIDTFRTHPDRICRLAYDGEPGNPVIFPRSLYEELANLPSGRGGGIIAKKYPERVMLVPVRNKYELFDVDTKEQLEELISLISPEPSPSYPSEERC